MAEYTDVVVSVNSDNDSTIDDGAPTTNYGSSVNLLATTIPFPSPPPPDQIRRFVIHFPDVVIPSDVDEIISGNIRIYLANFISAIGRVETWVEIYETLKVWLENTVTWNFPWVTPGGDFGSNPIMERLVKSSEASGWVEFDLTSYIEGLTDLSANISGDDFFFLFKLRHEVSADDEVSLDFRSREHANIPTIKVTFRD